MKKEKQLYSVRLTCILNGNTIVTENVTKVKLLSDGRMFIHYLEFCKTCKEMQKMVRQVPIGYTLENITHESAEKDSK